jgi:hypothetical protein
MKIIFPTTTVSGLYVEQQFVPVAKETGVLVSSGSTRVTGAQAQSTVVVEVRRGPTRTVEMPFYLEESALSSAGS